MNPSPLKPDGLVLAQAAAFENRRASATPTTPETSEPRQSRISLCGPRLIGMRAIVTALSFDQGMMTSVEETMRTDVTGIPSRWQRSRT
jgi:hypothetical protein